VKSAIEVLKSRRSIRTYTQQPVDKCVIEDIVDCARLAPTAMNDQPWDFVVVTAKDALASLPVMLGHGEFLASETTYGIEDSCAATENLLIAAEAHGIGACWVAGNKQSYGPVVAKAFGAPADRQLVAIVSFGYPAEKPQVEKRLLTDVLHWDRF
jgi:nitroreductase